MSKFLDTEGNSVISVSICDRCRQKRAWVDLVPDGNSPGLMVCKESVHHGCRDVLDPYRLPARQPDKLTNLWARPDVSIALNNK